MTATATAHHVTTVIDNPAYAWRNVDEPVKNAWYARLNEPDFVHDYIAKLNAKATEMFGPILGTVWAEHGYQLTPGPDGDTMLRRPTSPPWHKVWDEACRRLNPHAVVFAAGLDDVLLDYAAAHPRTEHLAHACAGLRPHAAQLRTELHDRLDRHAAKATDPRAETQLDGWRNAVDTAVTRTQLDYLAAEIPA